MARNLRKDQSLLINTLPEKATPVSADVVQIADSADSNAAKKVQLGNLPAGASAFLDLTDTPSSYSGQGGKVVAVNSGASALEFITGGGGGGGGGYNEDKFSTDGTETPGEVVSFELDNAPMTSTNTPSGYALTMFRNGVKMDYANPPTTYSEYYYDSVNNEVDILATGEEKPYEAVYYSVGIADEETFNAVLPGEHVDGNNHSKSDEFNGTVLDTKWSWVRAGVLNGAGEAFQLKNGWACGLVGNGQGSGTWDWLTHAHCISQPIPSNNFSVWTRIAAAFVNLGSAGIWFDNGSNSAIIWNFGMQSTTTPRWELTYYTGGTPSFDNIPYEMSGAVFGKVAYNVSTRRYDFYCSCDGVYWYSPGNYTPAWNCTRFGLYWMPYASGNVFPIAYSFFRVSES